MAAPHVSPVPYRLIQEPDAGYQPIIDLIRSAVSSVRMTTYELADDDAVTALADAHRRGVDVKVILDTAFHGLDTKQAAYDALNAAGVDVKWAPNDVIYHQLSGGPTLEACKFADQIVGGMPLTVLVNPLLLGSSSFAGAGAWSGAPHAETDSWEYLIEAARVDAANSYVYHQQPVPRYSAHAAWMFEPSQPRSSLVSVKNVTRSSSATSSGQPLSLASSASDRNRTGMRHAIHADQCWRRLTMSGADDRPEEDGDLGHHRCAPRDQPPVGPPPIHATNSSTRRRRTAPQAQSTRTPISKLVVSK
jgi:hypothetical protein